MKRDQWLPTYFTLTPPPPDHAAPALIAFIWSSQTKLLFFLVGFQVD